MTETTLYWHDYETWGLNPRADRPAQFAGIRTNLALQPIGEETMIYCRPSGDFLPHPESVLITGITPQQADAKGLNEAEFFRRIERQLARPGTCGVGYNSLRFDDEVTRFGFYRNFIDPYAREWRDGNSRWDILDLVRMAYALRPEGIQWPQREPGVPSFRLEDLTAANGIAHEGAHDALADVRATIGLARLIKQHQPRMYDYYFGLRRKDAAAALLDLRKHTPLLHVSGMYPSVQGCIAPVMPVVRHPRNKNEVIVADLRADPTALLTLSAEQIGENLFTKGEDLPEGSERVGLKSVHINKSPALAPMSTLTPEAARRWAIDLAVVERHRGRLLADRDLAGRVRQVYEQRAPMEQGDADSALYAGFIGDADRRTCDQVRHSKPEALAKHPPGFADRRLQDIFPRYMGRNWPELLSEPARREWREFCRARVVEGEFGSTLTFGELEKCLAELRQGDIDAAQRSNLEALEQWCRGLVE